MTLTTLLVVSHRAEIIAEIRNLMAPDNIRICQIEKWQQAQTSIEEESPQLILLDSPVPAVVGLSVCRKIRSRYQGLLMLLAGDNDEHLHSLALSMGVDVSLAGDTGLGLVTEQIRALLRRFAMPETPAVQTFGKLTVDANKRDVFVAEQAAQLSTVEFNLFWALVKYAGSVVSRDDIHRNLYNSPYNGYDRGIDIYISRIRQKIGDDPITPRYLKTVRGEGYQFIAVTD